jgi:hypothetical protein
MNLMDPVRSPPRDQVIVELVPGLSSLWRRRYARSTLWESSHVAEARLDRPLPNPPISHPPFFPKSYGLAVYPALIWFDFL